MTATHFWDGPSLGAARLRLGPPADGTRLKYVHGLCFSHVIKDWLNTQRCGEKGRESAQLCASCGRSLCVPDRTILREMAWNRNAAGNGRKASMEKTIYLNIRNCWSDIVVWGGGCGTQRTLTVELIYTGLLQPRVSLLPCLLWEGELWETRGAFQTVNGLMDRWKSR